MSKVSTGVIMLLCLATATAAWMIYAIEWQRHDREIREIQGRYQAALEMEMYQAWHHATRYETFWIPLANSEQEPKRTGGLGQREVWVKSFQRSDVKPIGKSKKYGNASYQVASIIGYRDLASKEMLEYLFRKKATEHILDTALKGFWHHVTVRCKVERMDGPGNWIATDWEFSPVTYTGDFPFEKVKGDQ